MTPQRLVSALSTKGIKLEAKLKASGQKPDGQTLDLIKANKFVLMAYLTTECETVPKLPFELERLIGAASSSLLTFHHRDIPDVNRYVTSWGCSYLTGDKQEALKRLWQIYHLWQEVN